MKLNPTDKELIELTEEDYNKLPDSVKGYLSNITLIFMNNILSEVEGCESPIETLLGIAMAENFPKTIGRITDDFFVTPQETIVVDGKRYRVDFFIAIALRGEHKGFVVECDGHDFHEKTKEQAKRDRKRERDLMRTGHQVIRFTGSEIYENPNKCARDVANIITKNILGG